MRPDNSYVPMNRGVAYDDMTPDEKQAYHERIAAVRQHPHDGFVSLTQLLFEIVEQWQNGDFEDEDAA